MYIPKFNLATDREQIIAFMQRFSFATIISNKGDVPIASHLPFLVSVRNDKIILTSHFARANEQWQHLAHSKILVIFSEPHAYISTKNYDTELNVPTWNYISVHAYGKCRLMTDRSEALEVINVTIDNFESDYRLRWDAFPEEYKFKMLNGIVAFEIVVDDLQAKSKLSQNRTHSEKQKIIESLGKSSDFNERTIAEYMLQNESK